MKYTPQEAMNIQMGQVGSAVLTDASTDVTPPTGCVIVAIQILESSTKISSLDSEDDTRFMNQNSASHSGSADTEHGTGGDLFPSTAALYPGMVMYGRWTAVQISQGGLIVYFGK